MKSSSPESREPRRPLAGIAFDQRQEFLPQVSTAERTGHKRAPHRVLAPAELHDGAPVHRGGSERNAGGLS
ncbi:hypothetical protein GCM10022214_13690 [Actinomadura miaoliensis]|uniref:DUF397 domain-containing protein n=1 Tax=Actinomadura miaoliensis TaxID=430685 RepID=A0ABP7V8I2_9ACTN